MEIIFPRAMVETSREHHMLPVFHSTTLGKYGSPPGTRYACIELFTRKGFVRQRNKERRTFALAGCVEEWWRRIVTAALISK